MIIAVVVGKKNLKPRITAHPDLVCEHCHRTQGLVSFTYPQYIHIFYIPFFSVGKLFRLHCEHCGYDAAFEPLHRVPNHLKNLAKKERHAVKTPWYAFLGLFILFALFIWLVFLDIQANIERNDHTKQYLSHPQVNDLYIIQNTTDNHYTVYKVTDVQNDSLSFISMSYPIDFPGGVKTFGFDKNNYLAGKNTSWSMPELQSFYAEGKLYEIIRK